MLPLEFSISNIIHITISVPSSLLWCHNSSQVQTIQERWRFKSIPNQLVIYSSNKPHSPIKWAIDHQWHFLGKHRGVTIMDHTTQGPPDYQDAPWAHSSRPRLTPFGTSLPIRVYPDLKSVTSFTVERYFIRPAKCEACVQYDKRDKQWSVHNWHRQKTNSTLEPCLVASNSSVWSPIIHQHMVNFRISPIP
jgi:hypothetical protein